MNPTNIYYHKINSLYKRGDDHKLMAGEWSVPEFGYLQDCEWVWTEKIDGTNIVVEWDGAEVKFHGRTKDAVIHPLLLKELNEFFTSEKLSQIFRDKRVLLHGEGIGFKIGKNGKRYRPDSHDFILFDVRINGVFLEREDVCDIACGLDVAVVPVVFVGQIFVATELVKRGFISKISQDREFMAEGLVGVPTANLLSRNRERIIAKIRREDYVCLFD